MNRIDAHYNHNNNYCLVFELPPMFGESTILEFLLGGGSSSAEAKKKDQILIHLKW